MGRGNPRGVDTKDNRWFGIVQSVHASPTGGRSFQIIWYYRPVDTICGVLKYPIRNELFLSNHCTCHDGLEIHEEEVLGVHSVAFYPDCAADAEFVCRQTYDMKEKRFTTFTHADRACSCHQTENQEADSVKFSNSYRPGDAVLAELKRGDTRLEPCEIIDSDYGARRIVLRRLFRRSEVDPNASWAKPNELVYSDEITTPAQRKNQSLVAAFASMVDVYRPRFGILENVVGIVQKQKLRHEDVFSQLVCALVGIGYQVQMLCLDAWSHGACQSRSRVFLVFAAPGETLPNAPAPSHSHPPHVRNYGLGTLNNGEKMMVREFDSAYAFQYRSASEATADLPFLYDGKVEYCIPFPDHVPAASMTQRFRAQVKSIPRFPPGMSFSSAWNDGHGVMTLSERALFPAPGVTRVRKGSQAWKRTRPSRLLPTVTTAQCPTDFKTGCQTHWAAERFLTLQESRRAQGFPDHEVLVGCVRDRWKSVGNSVARQISLVLGLSLRSALWDMYDEDADNGNGVDGLKNDSHKEDAPVATPRNTAEPTNGLVCEASTIPDGSRSLRASSGLSNE
ncbi:unnamed protein product [Parascedosporium putredinis]|uniref:DNA (cytosine-5-)-methyltransferase n=1 Tax=Parascedosporium putredinis TaxID=1442378 RepID=A0A9P1H6M4_9PEZI|nr:unnamed protein product [Parascedosporium putredinis]CAI8000367.1 unnamed protein product [Parascedosporium putredinis]